MSVFEIWSALLSCNDRFEIRLFVLLPTKCALWLLLSTNNMFFFSSWSERAGVASRKSKSDKSTLRENITLVLCENSNFVWIKKSTINFSESITGCLPNRENHWNREIREKPEKCYVPEKYQGKRTNLRKIREITKLGQLRSYETICKICLMISDIF